MGDVIQRLGKRRRTHPTSATPSLPSVEPSSKRRATSTAPPPSSTAPLGASSPPPRRSTRLASTSRKPSGQTLPPSAPPSISSPSARASQSSSASSSSTATSSCSSSASASSTASTSTASSSAGAAYPFTAASSSSSSATSSPTASTSTASSSTTSSSTASSPASAPPPSTDSSSPAASVSDAPELTLESLLSAKDLLLRMPRSQRRLLRKHRLFKRLCKILKLMLKDRDTSPLWRKFLAKENWGLWWLVFCSYTPVKWARLLLGAKPPTVQQIVEVGWKGDGMGSYIKYLMSDVHSDAVYVGKAAGGQRPTGWGLDARWKQHEGYAKEEEHGDKFHNLYNRDRESYQWGLVTIFRIPLDRVNASVAEIRAAKLCAAFGEAVATFWLQSSDRLSGTTGFWRQGSFDFVACNWKQPLSELVEEYLDAFFARTDAEYVERGKELGRRGRLRQSFKDRGLTFTEELIREAAADLSLHKKTLDGLKDHPGLPEKLEEKAERRRRSCLRSACRDRGVAFDEAGIVQAAANVSEFQRVLDSLKDPAVAPQPLIAPETQVTPNPPVASKRQRKRPAPNTSVPAKRASDVERLETMRRSSLKREYAFHGVLCDHDHISRAASDHIQYEAAISRLREYSRIRDCESDTIVGRRRAYLRWLFAWGGAKLNDCIKNLIMKGAADEVSFQNMCKSMEDAAAAHGVSLPKGMA